MLSPMQYVYDLTHLVSRLTTRSPTGIDRIDLSYARHFIREVKKPSLGLHYGLLSPHILGANTARDIVATAEEYWRDAPDLKGGADINQGSSTIGDRKKRFDRTLTRAGYRLAQSVNTQIPQDAIYLNVAQHCFEHPRFFKWIKSRPDILNVFFIHDLLPIDYPEYFPPSNASVFERRLTTALENADVFLTSTKCVSDRLSYEIRVRGLKSRPIHSAHFGSPLEHISHSPDEDCSQSSYFLMIGTIEPRKNHLMILHIWRDLVSELGDAAPKLILVGGRGWENEQVIDMLERSPLLDGQVIEMAGIPANKLHNLLTGANALLMPAFDEGFGLPILEALALGTPVIASDTPVFREVAQNCARFLSPIDGIGWRAAIKELASPQSSGSRNARLSGAGFNTPSWKKHFESVEVFLTEIHDSHKKKN